MSAAPRRPGPPTLDSQGATQRWVITIHPDAPAKPATGTPCNGCGLCCLAEPCPVGMLVSRRRHGACAALRWVDSVPGPQGGARTAAGAYRCGLISAPHEQVPAWLPRRSPALAGAWARLLQALARRFISAGSGCDADLEIDDEARGRHVRGSAAGAGKHPPDDP